MKDLKRLENRLFELQEELKEICRLYPYYEVNGLQRCQSKGITIRNEINREIYNTKVNINQVKMQMMNQHR